jgi:hypothetical protein
LLEERGQSDPALWSRIDTELSDLDMRVEALRGETAPA